MASTREIMVIGGGHAGVEAAMASARLGIATCLVTLRRSAIGELSCNPSIGGLGKGQLVKEIDALGGVMGRAIDAGGIQFKTLNASKGPAVRASRAQADRDLYKKHISSYVEAQPNLRVVEAEVVSIEVKGTHVVGVRLADDSLIPAASIILTAGTFLRGLMHTGATQSQGGRYSDKAANLLSESLLSLGFSLIRLKTGTPARLRMSSIDLSKLEEQPGDFPPKPFSMMTEAIDQPQISCWISATNTAVHDLIRKNQSRSPLFNGQIKSGGPRYCPSIEDKVFRFPDKDAHNIFLEPEGYGSDVVYPNGISTSLPADVQQKFVRLIDGLENVEIIREGYAIEYDSINPTCLKLSLESKEISGLFFAGQINGTSGYEEAAAQGLVAGTNAASFLLERPPLIVSRAQGYIGVMIDDLVTKGVDEPYRMFTSRAEYRLLLREDNSALRLCPLGIEFGLLSNKQRKVFDLWVDSYQKVKSHANQTRIKPTPENTKWLNDLKAGDIKDSLTLAELVKRPELKLAELLERFPLPDRVRPELIVALETELKFSGYIKRQEEEVAKLRTSEAELIPHDLCYDSVDGLRVEYREKLKAARPHSIGQALRLPGMTPGAISVLSIYLRKYHSVLTQGNSSEKKE